MRAIALLFWVFPIWIISFYWAGIATLLSVLMTEGNLVLGVMLMLFACLSPFILLAFAHHILFGRSRTYRPIWIPSRTSWWEGLSAFGATLMSLVTVVFLVMPFVHFDLIHWDVVHSHTLSAYDYAFFTELDSILITLLWIVASAFAYHWQTLAKRRFTRHKKTSRAAKTSL